MDGGWKARSTMVTGWLLGGHNAFCGLLRCTRPAVVSLSLPANTTPALSPTQNSIASPPSRYQTSLNRVHVTNKPTTINIQFILNHKPHSKPFQHIQQLLRTS